ncbi:hypothetical protein F8R89_30905 [Streptomyces sp. SS1-1]|uniref:hypothetical protein n=1 Tax=Streptomyces sp. SS1-1 TaxID=2651869 RepID=UPI0012500D85|nr:hypothetical protein [Streptomyces sp. SS1-1]KAB2976019.1 hypothetical protein F8R89_30905 [Streptomyces sp. SS1-1]
MDRTDQTQAQHSPAHTPGNDDNKPVIPKIPHPRPERRLVAAGRITGRRTTALHYNAPAAA